MMVEFKMCYTETLSIATQCSTEFGKKQDFVLNIIGIMVLFLVLDFVMKHWRISCEDSQYQNEICNYHEYYEIVPFNDCTHSGAVVFSGKVV